LSLEGFEVDRLAELLLERPVGEFLTELADYNHSNSNGLEPPPLDTEMERRILGPPEPKRVVKIWVYQGFWKEYYNAKNAGIDDANWWQKIGIWLFSKFEACGDMTILTYEDGTRHLILGGPTAGELANQGVALVSGGMILTREGPKALAKELLEEAADTVLEQATGIPNVGSAAGGIAAKVKKVEPCPVKEGSDSPTLPAFTHGGKTSGILRTPTGDVSLQSGWQGPASSIPRGTSGFDIVTRTHVEGHAAAVMQQQGLVEATVYINNLQICPSCSSLLPRMLPPGSSLTVVLPNGTSVTFVGAEP
jgi:hypothetical protein